MNNFTVQKIPLTQGKYALVDTEDYRKVSAFKWHLHSGGYAARDGYVNGKKVTSILMHREIINTPFYLHTDHINGNKLDNRKCNLRVVNRFQNLANAKIYKNNKSGYKGVSWHKQRGKWQARIRIGGKYKSLGLFSSKEDAANAYNLAALNARGDFARINQMRIKN